MKRRIGKALDHLIYLHRIEERKSSCAGCVWLVGAVVLVLGCLFTPDTLPIGREGIAVASASAKSARPAICSVESTTSEISLTFDVAWSDKNIGEILEILSEQEVLATFFVTGEWVAAYPESTQAILSAGHDLGNHSNSHTSMSMLSDTEKKEEILTVHKTVKELTGYEMDLFRPPHGDCENGVTQAAEECGYYTILWDVNSYDWKDYRAEQIVEVVTGNSNLGPGSIILCHGSGLYTTEALEGMIVSLKEKGYTFAPVSKLIYRENYYIDMEGHQMITNVINDEY